MVIFYSANNKHIPKTSGKENKHVPKMGQTCSQDGANMFPRWGKIIIGEIVYQRVRPPLLIYY